MNNKLTNIFLGAILVVGVIILIIGLRPGVQPNIIVNPPEVTVNPVLGGENEFYSGVTATTVGVSATNIGTAASGTITQVMAANSGRQYARIQNMGNTRVSCVLADSTSTLAVGKGIVLYNSSTLVSFYEINPNNLYKGVVRCLSETATCTVSVVEK